MTPLCARRWTLLGFAFAGLDADDGALATLDAGYGGFTALDYDDGALAALGYFYFGGEDFVGGGVAGALEGSPHVPTGDGAVGAPALAEG